MEFLSLLTKPLTHTYLDQLQHMTRTDIPGLPYLVAYRKKLQVELSFPYVGCNSTSHCVL